jgi:hypothetical protein
MKTTIKILLITVMLLAALCCLASCSTWDSPYEDFAKEGYDIKIRFDATGGYFGSANKTDLVNVYTKENAPVNGAGMSEIYIQDPNERGKDYTTTKQDYVFIGWYTERKLRTDDKGNMLDEYGRITTDASKQSYIYSGMWDFSKPLNVASDKSYGIDEFALTLYAAWAPRTMYQIYQIDANGSLVLDANGSPVINEVYANKLSLPDWKDGEMNYGSFLKLDDKTFNGASLSADFKDEYKEKEFPSGVINYEKGILEDSIKQIYTKWLDGTWFKVSKLEHLTKNAFSNGIYVLEADLDFTDKNWPSMFSSDTFTGKIIGNGHKISNVKIRQRDITAQNGGLFAVIGEGAVIENVSFENITYTVETGSRKQGASFGLLAGSLSSEARLTNVSLSGVLKIADKINKNESCTIGIVSGNSDIVKTGIDTSKITCEAVTVDLKGNTTPSESLTVKVEENGLVTLTFEGK